MSELEDFVGRVRGLLISLHGILTSTESSEVEYLIDHGEPGESAYSPCWIIVDRDKKIPVEAYEAIRER
jgi:hypothetical protein